MTACTNVTSGAKSKDGEKINVSIYRVDHSIKGADGQVVAKIYYDKPVLSGDSNVSKAVNSFFAQEAQDWLTGKASRLSFFQGDYLDWFMSNVKEDRSALGDKEMASQPFLYTVDTKIMLHNDTLLSVMQTVSTETAGPRGQYYFGSTFDLQTGKLIPINALVKTDADSLRTMIASFLKKQETEWEKKISMAAAIKIYQPNSDHNYEINSLGGKSQLNYEYFYDGQYFYIILNDGIFLHSGCFIKWNGQYGVNCKTSLE